MTNCNNINGFAPLPGMLLCSRQHDRQLDPTEIVVIPYNLQRLAIYVSSVTSFVVFIGKPAEVWPQTLAHLLQLTAAAFAVFIVCGASPYENLGHTTLAATYFATMCWGQPTVFASTIAATNTMIHWSVWPTFLERYRGSSFSHRLISPSTSPAIARQKQQQQQQRLLETVTLHACIACTIPMQILLLYDRGWQWQRWPIPVVLGSTLGWIGANILGTLVVGALVLDVDNQTLLGKD
jgi:hypothetical protein